MKIKRNGQLSQTLYSDGLTYSVYTERSMPLR